jgi:hypothetical protein
LLSLIPENLRHRIQGRASEEGERNGDEAEDNAILGNHHCNVTYGG